MQMATAAVAVISDRTAALVQKIEHETSSTKKTAAEVLSDEASKVVDLSQSQITPSLGQGLDNTALLHNNHRRQASGPDPSFAQHHDITLTKESLIQENDDIDEDVLQQRHTPKGKVFRHRNSKHGRSSHLKKHKKHTTGKKRNNGSPTLATHENDLYEEPQLREPHKHFGS